MAGLSPRGATQRRARPCAIGPHSVLWANTDVLPGELLVVGVGLVLCPVGVVWFGGGFPVGLAGCLIVFRTSGVSGLSGLPGLHDFRVFPIPAVPVYHILLMFTFPDFPALHCVRSSGFV